MGVFRQIKACRPPVCNRFFISLTSVAVSILSVLSSYGGMNDGVLCFSTPRPDKAASCAVQIGFELWQRDGRPMPECSGLVARPGGFAEGEAARGVEAERALEVLPGSPEVKRTLERAKEAIARPSGQLQSRTE